MNTEKNRLIIREMARKAEHDYNNILTNVNMWLVYVITWNDFSRSYEIKVAYFQERYEAEKWFTEKINGKNAYYGYCCNKNVWHNIYELLESNN